MDIQEIDSWPRLVAWGLEKAVYGLIVLALLWGIREYLQARELAIRDIYQATVADVFAQTTSSSRRCSSRRAAESRRIDGGRRGA